MITITSNQSQMINIHRFLWIKSSPFAFQVESSERRLPDQSPGVAEQDPFSDLNTPDPKPDLHAPEKNKKLSEKLTPLLHEAFGAGTLDISKNDPTSLIAGEWITKEGKSVSFNFTGGNTIGLYYPIDPEGIWKVPILHRFPKGQKGPNAIRAGFKWLLSKVDAIQNEYGIDIKNAKRTQDYLSLYNKITKALGEDSLYFEPNLEPEESVQKMEMLRDFYEKSFLPAFQTIFKGEFKIKALTVGVMEISWSIPGSPNSNTINFSPQGMHIEFPDAGKAAGVGFRQSDPNEPESFPTETDLALGLRYLATKTLCQPFLKVSR